MAQGQSPLVGYNTNVRHKGKLYHIQTEDSGINRPHIITHLFADGGRIIASKKTSYADYVGAADDLQALVKQMMKDQHKAMFIGLRDGQYDENDDGPSLSTPPAQPSERPPVDFAALDAAAAKLSPAKPGQANAKNLYASTRKPTAVSAGAVVPSRSETPASIFGGDLLSEKSLDEVILSYLAEDLDEA